MHETGSPVKHTVLAKNIRSLWLIKYGSSAEYIQSPNYIRLQLAAYIRSECFTLFTIGVVITSKLGLGQGRAKRTMNVRVRSKLR